MTYCVAVRVDQGLVFASDSRTNAGVDHISTYAKMHTFCGDGERFFVLLSAGSLATSRAVVTRLQRDLEEETPKSLKTVRRLTEAAEYIGQISLAEQRKHAKSAKGRELNTGASFVLGGQIRGHAHSIVLIYPEGNSHPGLPALAVLADRRGEVRETHPRSHHRADPQPGGRGTLRARLHGLDHAEQRQRRGAHRSSSLPGGWPATRQSRDLR